MSSQRLDVKTVAVIGAGVSGVSAAVHLKRAGLNVTVYERSSRAGGVWAFDERTPKDAAYPSILPSIGDSPEADLSESRDDKRCDSPLTEDGVDGQISRASENRLELNEDIEIIHAPPGPCYYGLHNNVSTTEMELQCQSWKEGTEEFVPHHVLGDYIQDAAYANGVIGNIEFDTRVQKVDKVGSKWRVRTSKLTREGGGMRRIESEKTFGAVVVASGHYHACQIPDLPGLREWKAAFPDQIQHSKLYRRPQRYKDCNVLLVGAGVSSTDIARELGPIAKNIYQVSRGGMFDLPSHILPDNAARVGAIKSFDPLPSSSRTTTNDLENWPPIPATVTLADGTQLCDIHHVILCTGYHVSFPFMRQYHADAVRAADANDTVLVTDGTQTHNLHLDMLYIPDPTLSFIGVPYHVATFSFFEFQAMALARVYAGRATLPSEQAMRAEYNERLARKKAGRTFHSLRAEGDEVAYVNSLVALANAEERDDSEIKMTGHSVRFHEAYARRRERQGVLFGKTRDPAIDRAALESVLC